MADEKKQNGVVTEGEQPFEVIPGTNLYVKYLDDGMDDEWLTRTFGKFGTITSAKVMRHQGGASKGFGFVCFSKPEEAEAAKNNLNGRMFSAKPLYVNIAQKKQDRVAFLQEQFNNKNFGVSPTAALDGWTAPVENGKHSTPPRTVASPQQVKNNMISSKHVSQAAMPVVRPSTLTLPQQVGGVNGYVLMGHTVGQPVAAPRPTGFIYAPTSAVQHPSVPVQYAWPAYGHPTVNTINQAQPLLGVRPTHHIHVAPANPAPLLLNHAAKIPHVHVGQQNNPALYHQLQIPYGVGQSVNIPNVRVHPVGVATYPQAPSHSVWANGLG